MGQGSILTVTSYAARTSPVLRGKYVLDNLLASPPPPPPPDVPSLATEDASDGAPLNLREAMIRHRANPVCAGCHAKMDPIGFALEHFDAVGRWRDEDAGAPIDAKSELPDGSVIDGPEGVQALLTARPELFVSALTEKLMMYALGRNVQYYDAPAVRAVVRAAASRNYEFSAIVEGIVASVPFQMRAGACGRGNRCRGGDRDGRGRAMTFKPGTFLSQKALPRRTFLRGAGATLALPLLDAMVPAFAADRAPWTPRLGFVYVGNGIVHKTFKPTGTGTKFELSPVLRPLAPLREHLTVISGLDHAQANNFGDGTGDHPRSSAAWLTGVHAYDRTQPGVEVKLATTADQLAADVLGASTPVRSLELAVDTATQSACDSGDCFYVNTVSWRNETTPNLTENHPRVVFERLFGDGGSAAERLDANAQDGEHSRLGSRGGESPRRVRRPQRSQQARRVSRFRARDRATHRCGGSGRRTATWRYRSARSASRPRSTTTRSSCSTCSCSRSKPIRRACSA